MKIIIHSTHGHIFYGYFGSLKTTIFLWMERLSAWITDKITTLSNLEIADYQRLRLAKREKFVSISYGIDTEKYMQSDPLREEMRQMLGITPQDFVIGWIGRLVPVVGQARGEDEVFNCRRWQRP